MAVERDNTTHEEDGLVSKRERTIYLQSGTDYHQSCSCKRQRVGDVMGLALYLSCIDNEGLDRFISTLWHSPWVLPVAPEPLCTSLIHFP